MTVREQTDFIVNIYRKRAPGYDFRSYFYYLIGYRLQAYRKKAVKELQLKAGDTVVEIGCGTGLNLSILQNAVGSQGKIVGVDATDAMLNRAKNKVKKNDWQNVELVLDDAVEYQFPKAVNGIISTFALALMPNPERIIINGINALAQGGRWVVMDLRIPSNWISNLVPLFLPILKPFGVTKELIDQRPWEIIWNTFQRNLHNVSLKEIYSFGITYIASGGAN